MRREDTPASLSSTRQQEPPSDQPQPERAGLSAWPWGREWQAPGARGRAVSCKPGFVLSTRPVTLWEVLCASFPPQGAQFSPREGGDIRPQRPIALSISKYHYLPPPHESQEFSLRSAGGCLFPSYTECLL